MFATHAPTPILFNPPTPGAAPSLPSLPSLIDASGIVMLLEDGLDSAPQAHWMVRLGGGESRAIDARAQDRRAAQARRGWGHERLTEWSQAVA